MGAKTWMLAFVDGEAPEILRTNPDLDRVAATEIARRLFPSDNLEPADDGDLSYTCPPDDEIHIGCFPGLTIIAASEFAIDYPSRLSRKYLQAATAHNVYLHAMHSVVDWFAYAVWKGGTLTRSLSLSPESGILEDIGQRAAFEVPYWGGEHPLFHLDEESEDYPFPFHPLDLGEAALLELFGYQIEGVIDPANVAAEEIPLAVFKRTKVRKPRWKLW